MTSDLRSGEEQQDTAGAGSRQVRRRRIMGREEKLCSERKSMLEQPSTQLIFPIVLWE